MSDPATKPPIGLVPLFIRLDARRFEILDAIERYRNSEMIVPGEWFEELLYLTQWIRIAYQMHKVQQEQRTRASGE